MLRDIPKGLANTVRGIVEKSRQEYVEQKQQEAERIAAIREAKAHTVPKTAKEKDLAALAHPKDKITHKDVMVGRGVVAKEEVEQTAEAMSHAAATTMKHVKNPTAGEMQAAKDIKPGVKGYADRVAMLKSAEARGALKKEEVEKVEEATDTPGNSTHQCALHVKSEQFGEGRTLFSQHAEPDAEGNIAWYDVMFEHGIEKKVPTAELDVLVSESHMSHKKKK